MQSLPRGRTALFIYLKTRRYVMNVEIVLNLIKELEDRDFERKDVREPIYKLAKKYPDIFVEIFTIEKAEDIVKEYILYLAKSFRKIPVIKAVRKLTGLDLKETKNLVEDIVGYDSELYGNSSGYDISWEEDKKFYEVQYKLKNIGGYSGGKIS
jgi:ribosomal protein L7/L12